LRIAIAEANRQLAALEAENAELQQKIIAMRQRSDGYNENKQVNFRTIKIISRMFP
jgi:hypothetical protein